MDGPLVNSGIPLETQTVVSPVPQTSTNLTANPRDKRRTPAFLSNLGKATLRGIRKCPQCGYYNGTRGLSCKNKACGTVFRDVDHRTGHSKKGASEVVQVVTDSGGRGGGLQVFSVRQRGRGSEQRGFVALALTDTAITTADGTVLTRVNVGRCYMPSCQQNESDSTVDLGVNQQESQPSKSPCTHVKQAMECQIQATPLPLKSSVLEALVASSQAKAELWRLATETPGPLVQRVSKGTLIVKCQPGEAHPLGLLHLTVGVFGFKEKTEGAAPFRCACYAANVKGDLVTRSGNQSNVQGENSHGHSLPECCLHFFACVCAFRSDEKLTSEFSAFLNYNMNGIQQSADSIVLAISESQQHSESFISHRPKRHKFVESSTGSSQPVDEMHVSLSFQKWLSSVTERIHQTMHFQFDGTCSAEQTEPVPFVIEWIPDILPHSQVGELRIRFEYGHQLGSKPEHCKSSAGKERTEQTIADAITQQ
ncbi:uncharacterized protein C2orf42 homolog isoform X4 [Danio rerio]|uniref:Uncharacterized protein C2orf42 homolog isoform X4 n=1 Tax=Danio rerio TaxID=7955 RepID=A0AC58JMB0_DANRE